jgi:hypothetical protein
MTSPAHRHPTVTGIAKMLLAVLVLVVRLGASLVPMPMDTPAQAAWGDGIVICHADATDPGPSGDAPARHPFGHPHECGLCPVCHFLAAAALQADGPPLAGPRTSLRPQPQAWLPQATGPPIAARQAARPRAPPAFSA